MIAIGIIFANFAVAVQSVLKDYLTVLNRKFFHHKLLYFNVIEYVTRDHSFMARGWSFNAGSTEVVHLLMDCLGQHGQRLMVTFF